METENEHEESSTTIQSTLPPPWPQLCTEAEKRNAFETKDNSGNLNSIENEMRVLSKNFRRENARKKDP